MTVCMYICTSYDLYFTCSFLFLNDHPAIFFLHRLRTIVSLFYWICKKVLFTETLSICLQFINNWQLDFKMHNSARKIPCVTFYIRVHFVVSLTDHIYLGSFRMLQAEYFHDSVGWGEVDRFRRILPTRCAVLTGTGKGEQYFEIIDKVYRK